jgi:hypothetical protein
MVALHAVLLSALVVPRFVSAVPLAGIVKTPRVPQIRRPQRVNFTGRAREIASPRLPVRVSSAAAFPANGRIERDG